MSLFLLVRRLIVFLRPFFREDSGYSPLEYALVAAMIAPAAALLPARYVHTSIGRGRPRRAAGRDALA